jgi:UPF0755 protein
MAVDERRDLILRRRTQVEEQNRDWQRWFRGAELAWTLLKGAILLVVMFVLLGACVVSNAHITEQFLGAPTLAEGYIDPEAGQFSLTPDSIEQQILAFNLRLRESELAIPAGTNVRPRPFTITPGEPARFIASRLEQEGFIRDGALFNLYLRVTGLERQVEAGSFMLAESMTMPEVAEALQTALFEEALVTIPEGMRLEEIAERLSENNIIGIDQFLQAVREPRTLALFADYDFLQALPAASSLEGFLFPDTYRLPVLGTPEQVQRPRPDHGGQHRRTRGRAG